MKKKVLFVMSTLNTGGAQKIISNIIMALPEEWEIDILLNDSENISYPYRGTIIDLGMKPTLNKRKLPYQVQILLRRFLTLKRLKKKNGYTACISAMDSANFVNILTGNRYCKTVPTIHGYHNRGWAPEKIEPIANKLVGATLRRADCVVTVSQGLADEMIEKFHVNPQMVQVIYNGYDVDEIRTKKQQTAQVKLPWTKDEKIVITSGRMEKIKGQWHLIKVFSEVGKRVPEARLIILGDGQLKRDLECLVERCGIRDKVYMPGFVDNPFAYIGNASVFVLTSLSEGYPNAIAEALICGIPCVSCDCEAGPREILAEISKKKEWDEPYIKEKYGILTPAFKVDEPWDNEEVSEEEKIMADAICELLQNQELYAEYRQKINEKAEAMDMKNVIAEWIKMLE